MLSWIRKVLPWLFVFLVTLSWDPSPSIVDGYRVYAGPLGGPYALQQTLGNVLTTQIELPDRSCFAVTAYRGNNESVLSNIVCEEILWDMHPE